MKKGIIGLMLIVCVGLFPHSAWAKDFTIDEFTIDAQLQEDGNVKVTEELTYQFDGSFNGITRDLYPKKGSKIQDVQAEENGKSLNIDGTSENYKIHRKAKDERVSITLHYTIVDGVERHSDMAQFYWPFFDDRNETDFSNVTISVHPPVATDDVIAMGYDAAGVKGKVQEDGSVVFQLGDISSGENGDVRVGYDEALFSAAPVSSKDAIRSELKDEQAALVAAQKRYDKGQKLSEKMGPFIVGGAVIVLLIMLIVAIRLVKRRKVEAQKRYPEAYFVPEAEMSAPAMIRFTSPHSDGAQVQTAAFLDLLRKGYIEKVDDNLFRVVRRDTDQQHEQLLIEWLFDEFGDGETFSFENLKVLEGDELVVHEDVERFRLSQNQWESSVGEEVKRNHIKGDVKAIRFTSILTGILLIVPMIGFGIYGKPMWLFLTLVPSIALLLFGFLFNPKTVKGYGLMGQWETFRKKLPTVSEADLKDQLDDAQKRAIIYGVGTNSLEQNNLFTSTSRLQEYQPSIVYYYVLGSSATYYFTGASTAVASSSSTSSGGGISGGGVGGGGGGAGAF